MLFRSGIFTDLAAEFKDRNPQVKYITTTYRCPEPVVRLANNVLAKDLEETVLMQGTGKAGTAIEVYDTGAEGLKDFLWQRYNSGVAWKDMMVLYRTRRHILELEAALAASEIPYKLADASFFEQSEVQDILCYFYCLYDPGPEYPYWRRIFNHFKGMGAWVAENTFEESGGNPIAHFAKFQQPKCLKHEGQKESWKAMYPILSDVWLRRGNFVDVAEYLKDFLWDHWGSYCENSEQLDQKIETVNTLIQWMQKFSTDNGFEVLQAIKSYEAGNRKTEDDADAVEVMTAHKSKGLEA